MMRDTITLYRNVKVGLDPLKNPIYEKELITKGKGQITPWTNEEIALLDRGITKTEEKLITQLSFEECGKASIIEVNGKEFTVEQVSNNIRWRVLRIKRYGV